MCWIKIPACVNSHALFYKAQLFITACVLIIGPSYSFVSWWNTPGVVFQGYIFWESLHHSVSFGQFDFFKRDVFGPYFSIMKKIFCKEFFSVCFYINLDLLMLESLHCDMKFKTTDEKMPDECLLKMYSENSIKILYFLKQTIFGCFILKPLSGTIHFDTFLCQIT